MESPYLDTPFKDIPEQHRGPAMVTALYNIGLNFVAGSNKHATELCAPIIPVCIRHSSITLKQNWQKKGMIYISGYTHAANTPDGRYIGVYTDPYHGGKANVSEKKTPQQIANDIKRRVYPQYCKHRDSVIVQATRAHREYGELQRAKELYIERAQLQPHRYEKQDLYNRDGFSLKLDGRGEPRRIELTTRRSKIHNDTTHSYGLDEYDVLDVLELFNERMNAAKVKLLKELQAPGPDKETFVRLNGVDTDAEV